MSQNHEGILKYTVRSKINYVLRYDDSYDENKNKKRVLLHKIYINLGFQKIISFSRCIYKMSTDSVMSINFALNFNVSLRFADKFQC